MLLEKMPTHFRDFLFSQPNGETVEIRTGLLDDQTIVFHASDLCRLLDLGNPTNAIAFHLDEDEAFKLNVGKHYDEWFVTKSGLYGLMLGSNKPQAKAFKRWLRKEVLVKLEASGGYILPTATSKQVKTLVAAHEEEKKELLKKIEETKQETLLKASKTVFNPLSVLNPEAHLLNRFKLFLKGLQVFLSQGNIQEMRIISLQKLLQAFSTADFDFDMPIEEGQELLTMPMSEIKILFRLAELIGVGDFKDWKKEFFIFKKGKPCDLVYVQKVIVGELDTGIMNRWGKYKIKSLSSVPFNSW